jgi:hypothetical protein
MRTCTMFPGTSVCPAIIAADRTRFYTQCPALWPRAEAQCRVKPMILTAILVNKSMKPTATYVNETDSNRSRHGQLLYHTLLHLRRCATAQAASSNHKNEVTRKKSRMAWLSPRGVYGMLWESPPRRPTHSAILTAP